MPSSNSKYLSFGFDGSHDFRDELRRPILEISVTLDRIPTPLNLVLWRQDGSGIWIWSKMHDVAWRDEVGILQFEMTSRDKKKSPDGDLLTVQAFSLEGLNGEHSVSKLVIEESGFDCESGVVLSPIIGRELVIVADAFPCHIAVLGLEALNSVSRPEGGKLSKYKRVPW